MEVFIRKYKSSDIKDMVSIWNEVVEEGVAFPQEDFLNEDTGRDFLMPRHTVEWHRMRKERYLDCIFFIRIMLADVVTYATQVMQ